MTKSGADQCVFIGGISGGIGSTIAKSLLSRNGTVGGFSRPSEKFDRFKEEHADFDLYDAEATDGEAVGRAISAFVEKHGRLDAYVHAVGSVFLKPLHLISDSEWNGILLQNLTSAFLAARACIAPMRRKKDGVFVFFSSVAAQAGLSNHEAIAAAKGGVEGLVKSISATYAANGIRANAIAPGLVRTPATAALTENEQALRFSERMHPLGRIGEPEEVASLVTWLVSKDASWMTGQVLSMDGGMGSIVPKPRA